MFNKAVVSKISALAKRIDVEPAALLAVAEVESAGVALWNVRGKSLPPIRFEGHYFHKRLKGKQRAEAIRQGLASPTAGAIKNPSSYSARYALLERARKINAAAADESTSWGVGQVMGAHWKKLGFKSVSELVQLASSGVDGQVDVMARYIQKFGLVDELQTHGWRSFAAQYNGPGYKSNRYDEKIAAAYKRYSRPGWTAKDRTENAVSEIQRDLATLGYYKGKVDGINGKGTKAAITKFQADHGLVADGIYGKMTDEAVDREMAKRQKEKGDTAIKTGTGVTGGGAVVDIINTQAEKLDTIKDYSHLIGYAVAAMVVIGVAITLYGMYKRLRAERATA